MVPLIDYGFAFDGLDRLGLCRDQGTLAMFTSCSRTAVCPGTAPLFAARDLGKVTVTKTWPVLDSPRLAVRPCPRSPATPTLCASSNDQDRVIASS
jgi:hypothetical protein